MATVYIHIVTPVKFSMSLPIVLSEHAEIVRLDGVVRERLKSALPLFKGIGPALIMNPYEVQYKKSVDENGKEGYIPAPLEEAEHRYFAIKSNGHTSRRVFEYIFMLLIPQIDLGIAVIEEQGALGVSSSSMSIFSPQRFNPLADYEINVDHINQVKAMISFLDNTEYPSLFRAMEMFYLARSIVDSPEITVLLLFTAIEAILTHKPQPLAQYESLNHQIQTKVNLLLPRMTRYIDHNEYFISGTKHKKIWNLLYSVRSQIAHGSIPKIGSSEYQVLKSWAEVVNYLTDIIKEILIHSMKEPELMIALQNC